MGDYCGMLIYTIVVEVMQHSDECYHSTAFTHGIPSSFIENKYFHIVCTSLLTQVYVTIMSIYHWYDSTWNHNIGRQ